MPNQKRVIIHVNHPTLQLPVWQNQLAESIKSPDVLIKALNLPATLLPKLEKAHKMFPLRVTQSYLDKIEKGNINDPLLRQILPLAEETIITKGYTTDPVEDKQFEKTPGLLHKYHGRVLLTLTGACGIHCRYCFRRHFDYSASNPSKQNWRAALEYIKNDNSIYEVIFSGGDPLSLSDQRLSKLAHDIDQITHLRFLRIHTRQITILPDRVDEHLLEWISRLRLKLIMVVHINHPNEIDQLTSSSLGKLRKIGVELLNQSVLLQGVNNEVNTLTQLSLKLIENGVKPYYLHMLDKAQGTAHFNVAESDAINIIKMMQEKLPGYAIPKLVREVPFTPYKKPINVS